MRFFQLKCHLKSLFEESILNDISIEKILKIFFSKMQVFFWKYFSNLIFSMIKNKLIFFLDIYIDVKFHALSIYEVFRAIRARQTTLWSLVRCWYQNSVFYMYILNAVSGPSGRWILCVVRRRSDPNVHMIHLSRACTVGEKNLPSISCSLHLKIIGALTHIKKGIFILI